MIDSAGAVRQGEEVDLAKVGAYCCKVSPRSASSPVAPPT